MKDTTISEVDQLVLLMPAWLQLSHGREIATGLDRPVAMEAGSQIRNALRQEIPPVLSEVGADLVESLHALASILADEEPSQSILDDAGKAFDFVKSLPWPADRFGGPAEILCRLSFLCWRAASHLDHPCLADQWLRRFHREAKLVAEITAQVLAISRTERDATHLQDPEQLLAICGLLRSRIESAPTEVRAAAEDFFYLLERSHTSIGRSDEQEFCLGEFALIAGTACRLLALRDEARRWFDRADSIFILAYNSNMNIARVAYQRLAVRLEERDLDGVMDLAPRWGFSFAEMDLPEDALKCRFLEAHALKESERLAEAKSVFLEIRKEALSLSNELLAATAAQNLFQILVFLGEPKEAIEMAREAAPVFARMNNRVCSAKLQLGVGYLLRSQGNVQDAIEAFRDAQRQFAEIGLEADVAATHLVLADLLLDGSQPARAEREIRAALPVIDELKLVPEGIAALSLLRDSVRRRQIDRQALRSLSGYFEELKS